MTLLSKLSGRIQIPGDFWWKTIAVASGKGGVGKSSFVASFSTALVQCGFRVLIFDGDLGMANLDLLFGQSPKKNLFHVIHEKCPLKEAIWPLKEGPDLIAGGNGFTELSLMEGSRLAGLIEDLARLQKSYHFLIIDTGAGIGSQVLSLCEAADETLVVTTPEYPSLANSYGLIKVLNQKGGEVPVSILSNRCESESEGGAVYQKLDAVCQKFINRPVGFFGYLEEDSHVFKAMKKQKPFFLEYPDSGVSRSMINVVDNFLKRQGLLGRGTRVPSSNESNSNVDGFFEKLVKTLRTGGCNG